MISPIVGTGTGFDSIRPQVADRVATPGDRLDYVIGTLDRALVAFDVATDNFAAHGGVVLALENELEGSFAALPAARRTALNRIGGAGTTIRERLRSAGRLIEPNFHEAKLLGASPPPRTGSFMSDSFTDTSGVLLHNHTAEQGSPWVKATGGVSDMHILSNRVRVSTAAQVSYYYGTADPASAEYDVETVVSILTLLGAGAIDATGGVARRATAADTGYEWFVFENGLAHSVLLRKHVAGVDTDLGTWATTWTAPSTVTLIGEIRDATKKVFVDGVERISSANNDITAAGRAGLFIYNSVAADATGQQFDSMSATDPGGAVVTPNYSRFPKAKLRSAD